MALAPERLLQQWLEQHPAQADAVIYAAAFPVPYQSLSAIDGWTLWLGHPPVPGGISLLPCPDELLWGEAAIAVATALLVGADYAVRRGAGSPAEATEILRREAPVAIVLPGPVHRSLEPILHAAEIAGLTLVRDASGERGILSQTVPAFPARASAHAANLGRPHDPGLSFELLSVDQEIGDTPDSSFVLHAEGKRDGVVITGELSERVAVEIGLGESSWTQPELAEWAHVAARMPSFLGGVTCREGNESVAIGWPAHLAPSAEQLGGVWHAWLKAFTRAPIVDVRLTFAAAGDTDSSLAEMRARAIEFRAGRSFPAVGDPI